MRMHSVAACSFEPGSVALVKVALICQKEFTQYFAESLGTCICEHHVVTHACAAAVWGVFLLPLQSLAASLRT